MNTIRTLTIASAVITLASCGLGKKDENYDTATAGYDTSNPYGVPSSGGYETPSVNLPAESPTYSPAAYEEPTTTPPATTASIPTAGGTSHVIGKGDTLWGLSRKYNVTADAIRAANGMTATDSNVRLGQTLTIPAH